MKLRVKAVVNRQAIDKIELDYNTQRDLGREEYGKARQVKSQLSQYFRRMVKGLGLEEFLNQHPVTDLFQSTDKDLRLKGNQIRSELKEFVDQLPQTDVHFFKEQFGSNVTDWLKEKVVGSYKKSSKLRVRANSLHGDLTVQNIRREKRNLEEAFDLMVAIHSQEIETSILIEKIEALLNDIYPPLRVWVTQRNLTLQYLLKFKESQDWNALQSAMDSLEQLIKDYSTRL
jgi:hypothetical protein